MYAVVFCIWVFLFWMIDLIYSTYSIDLCMVSILQYFLLELQMMSFEITFDENDSALQQLEMPLEISQKQSFWFFLTFPFFAAYNMVACRMTDARNGGNISQVPLKRSVDMTIWWNNDTIIVGDKLNHYPSASEKVSSYDDMINHHIASIQDYTAV